MTQDEPKLPSRAAVAAWLRDQLDLAVKGINERTIFEDPLVEVKPAWTLPLRIVVGMVREQRDPRSFWWFVSGEVPLDYLPPGIAESPRDALRHFALKWQLDAERADDIEHANALIGNAEAIYAVAEESAFWTEQS